MSSDSPASLDLEMSEFVCRLYQQERLSAKDVLAELTAGVVRFLPPAEHASVTVSARGEVATESATGAIPAALNEIQAQCGAGPCLSAATHEDVVRIDDVEHDQRWPDYSRAVTDRTPVRSVLSIALGGDSKRRYALNVYAEKPNAFDVGMTESALRYASYVSIAWTLARRDEQFHEALKSRDIIGQAKGMIMERFEVDATQAFHLLKRLSQSSNTPLARIAAEVVEAERRESRPKAD
ncbi:GAF and ANTAR domain-containing protein [Mycobacterium paraterrae]|uniref:GAF and ANTAR domain-containing protein n=1 Tax=Mycobacterium paraterrae TaxID=577492 RepID=A0ABY3VMJ6_9MYCO|nr:GAF and ANTAR domain-containing protein [Mycobacterium paraterrae]UMB70649.1 GAF and ANTAR domain-containing protein [Mycobacterium paraterrae]